MSMQQASGFCERCDAHVLLQRSRANHILHFLITIFTFGLWVIVWILCSIKIGGWRCSRCGSCVARDLFGGNVSRLVALVGGLLLLSQVSSLFDSKPSAPLDRPAPRSSAALGTGSAAEPEPRERYEPEPTRPSPEVPARPIGQPRRQAQPELEPSPADRPYSVVNVLVGNITHSFAGVVNGRRQDRIEWTLAVEPASLKKRTRLIKGKLEFFDQFGELKAFVTGTIEGPVDPEVGAIAEPRRWGMNYSSAEVESNSGLCWFLKTETERMTFRFRVSEILYADGTRETF